MRESEHSGTLKNKITNNGRIKTIELDLLNLENNRDNPIHQPDERKVNLKAPVFVSPLAKR